jgi:hypothetical protein
MYGEARAIARIAELAGRSELAESFHEHAERIRRLTIDKLWDPEAQFFKTRPRGGNERPLVDVRELHGFVPWYFRLPEPAQSVAWKQLMDPEGFHAPYGPTTAERRHPRFMFAHAHDCLWNGPSWPYATTQTLVALANLLNDYQQDVVDKRDYFTVLRNYARSQYKDGTPWIAENLDGITGQWIVDKPRSVDYNHSGYADLIINGLVGLRPSEDGKVVVNPLVPEGVWDYFCLEDIPYHGRKLTILYDKTGEQYNLGPGLRILVDGREIAATDRLHATSGEL